jgi:dynactin complex subunit
VRGPAGWGSSDLAHEEAASRHHCDALATIARVETLHAQSGVTSRKNKSFIYSQTNLTAPEVLGAVVSHRSIEDWSLGFST